MSSRFFRGDSDSESESSSESENEEVTQKTSVPTRFSRGTADSSEESDTETKRVVRSVKEKRLEELNEIAASIKSRIKANEWGFIQAGL